MGHVPDHSPAAAAAEHAALIVALDAGDLVGPEHDRAAELGTTCPGCASLLADLAVIRAATAALPAPPRRRDYRLTDDDAARLRPSAWVRPVGWLGAPRSTARPLAGALATLGIAGLLLGTTPGLFGQAATVTTGAPQAVAPGLAPSIAGGAGSPADRSSSLGAAPNATSGAAAAAGAAPVASAGTGAIDTTPGLAAPPAPSPLAVALPAPSPAGAAVPVPSALAVGVPVPSQAGGNVALPAPTPPGAGVVTGPAAASTLEPSGFSTGAGQVEGAPKAVAPEASQIEPISAAPSTIPTESTDRTFLLAVSLALLAAGIALYGANRALQRRLRG